MKKVALFLEVVFVLGGWFLFSLSFVSAAVCGNGICEGGEANYPGGCGIDADPDCLGPPGRAGSCPQDCNQSLQVSQSSCQNDQDCACGVWKSNGACAAGNKNYINSSIQCPDFCTGIAGNIKTKCVNNRCSLVADNNSDNLDCKNLYWFDDDNKSCGLKEFCGAYMYLGLETFESKTQCEKALIPEENKGQDKTFQLSNGRKAEIKVMPESASEKAIERLGELGFNVVLKEVGQGENAKVAYELTAEKEGKMIGLFKVKGKVSVQVDAETGGVIKVKRPWWSFFASGI